MSNSRAMGDAALAMGATLERFRPGRRARPSDGSPLQIASCGGRRRGALRGRTSKVHATFRCWRRCGRCGAGNAPASSPFCVLRITLLGQWRRATFNGATRVPHSSLHVVSAMRSDRTGRRSLRALIPRDRGPGPFVKIIEDHFRRHFRAAIDTASLALPVKMRLKTKVSKLPVILQLTALAMDRE